MAFEKVLLGGVWQEANTFQPDLTDRDSFQRRVEYFGEDILTELRGTNTAVGGALELADQESVEFIPTVYAEALPGGPVTKETYDFYTDYLCESVSEHHSQIDGVYLPLHGAMVAEHLEDGEGPLVSRVRDIVGQETPIVASFDLHGNITDEVIENLDGLVCYEEYPHVDIGKTGQRAFRLLIDIMRNKADPVIHIERPPMILLGHKTSTREGPGQKIMEQARKIEKREGVRKVNIFYGFSKADVPSMNVTVPVVGENRTSVQRASREMAEYIWKKREEFYPTEFPSPAEAVEQASTRISEGTKGNGPIVLCDDGDDPAAGTPGDGTHILSEILEKNVNNSGFAIIRDPSVVEECVDVGVGERVSIDLGGKSDAIYGGPIKNLEVYVKAITDGKFVNMGPTNTGSEVNFGKTVRLQTGTEDEINIIVTQQGGVPLDDETWRHIGIQPERLDLLVIKSEIYYGEDDDHIASDVIYVNSPGLASMDLSTFEFNRITRPKFPIDTIDDDEYPN